MHSFIKLSACTTYQYQVAATITIIHYTVHIRSLECSAKSRYDTVWSWVAIIHYSLVDPVPSSSTINPRALLVELAKLHTVPY